MIKDIFTLKETLTTNDFNFIPERTPFYKLQEGEGKSLYVSLSDEVRVIWLKNDLLELIGRQEVEEEKILSFSKKIK